jgi:PIN domain nuclease of toxin-antitoxin system
MIASTLLPDLHQDPFDRLLIAQAKAEPMRLLSHDAAMAAYGELVVTV